MSMHVTVSGWLLGSPSGANRRLDALLRCLGPRLVADERITVLHRPDFAPPAIAGIGWHAVAIPAGPAWQRVRQERRRLPGLLRELGATVHDHGFLPLPRVTVPICLVVHDLRTVDGLTRWPRWLGRFVLRRACDRAAAIVAPSRWTAARVQAIAKAAPAPIVVRNGIEMPPVFATREQRPAAGYLLHVGHVEPRKNLGVVVRALGCMTPDARPELWLAGRDAFALASLQSMAARTNCIVRALGVVDDARLASLYAGARAVVVPSRHEGFGLAALEGLAHGRPVLVSSGTAMDEVVGEHGTLLPADDAESWAAAIRATIRAVVADTGDRDRRRAWAATFGWAEPAERLLALWRRCGRR